MRLEDALRQQAKPKRRSEATGPCPGRCSCGAEFTSVGRWQKHSDEMGTGHRRWSIDLGSGTA